MTELVCKYPKTYSYKVAEKMILTAHWSIQVSMVTATICPQ